MFCLEQGSLVTSLVLSPPMEQDDKQGVCEASDSEDKRMGSGFENSEGREGDPEETGMGSNAQDAEQQGARLEQEMGSDPQEEAPGGDSAEQELVSDICTGEDRAGVHGRCPHSRFSPVQTCKGGSILVRECPRRYYHVAPVMTSRDTGNSRTFLIGCWED